LSAELVDEVKRHADNTTFNEQKDPLALWKAVSSSHKVYTTSKVNAIIKLSSRDHYKALKQGHYESIIAYNNKISASLQNYKEQENPPMSDTDMAIDFMNGLDDHRYDGFKVDLINGIGQGSMKLSATLNKMYMLASQKLTIGKCGTQQTLKVTLATKADKLIQKGGIGNKKKKEQEKKKMPRKRSQHKVIAMLMRNQKRPNTTNPKTCASIIVNMDTMHTSAHTKMKMIKQSVKNKVLMRELYTERAIHKVIMAVKLLCTSIEVILDNASEVSVSCIQDSLQTSLSLKEIKVLLKYKVQSAKSPTLDTLMDFLTLRLCLDS
jgi:hypothetical protein